MSEKKRGKTPGAGGEGDRPRIGSSHTVRPHDARASAKPGAPGRPSRPPRRAAGPLNGTPTRRSLPVPGAGPGGPRLRKARSTHPPGPPSSIASDEARALAVQIATAALEKKAISVEVLDVAGKVDYADFLVLMTGRSDRQVQAIAQGIEEELRKRGRRPQAVEGLPHARWVLMDYIDVVVHVFQDDARGAYDIDGLWMDARRIPIPTPEGD